jgi:hypothetical protein
MAAVASLKDERPQFAVRFIGWCSRRSDGAYGTNGVTAVASLKQGAIEACAAVGQCDRGDNAAALLKRAE